MNISMYYPPNPPTVRDDLPYIMVHMSPEEAAATIESLAHQLKNHSPNSGRGEIRVHGNPDGGYFDGMFTISVQPEFRCLQCGKDIKAYTGKLEKEGYICGSHLTHKEQGGT